MNEFYFSTFAPLRYNYNETKIEKFHDNKLGE